MSNENKTIGQHTHTPQSPELLQGQSYIFAVGINQYERCPTLYNAVKDAQHVVNLLTSKYQFDPAAVTTLFDKEATRRNIYRQLEDLAHKVAPEDNLLIYFSGHGTYKNIIDEGFWVPVDGDLEDPGSFIANSSIIKYLKAIRAHHIVIISDACFSGALFTEKFVGVRERQETIPSRWLMTSGRNEVVSDGKPGQHSPFADSLLLHLNSNKEEVLPVTKLSDAILEDVGGNSSQLPRCEPLRDVGHRGGEFMFRFKGSVAPPPPPPDPVLTPTIQRELPQPNWLEQTIRHPATKASALILTGLIAGFLVWAEFFNKPSAPAKPPRTYSVVQDAGENLLIVQGNNGRYGYARKADTALTISCKYEEAHAFRDGLARVKRNGKHGWIRPDSSAAIAEKYDYAGDFEDGLAEVATGRDTFSIDKNGARQQVNPGEIDPAPQFATIQVSPANKNLGKILRNSSGSFQFTLINNSSINARITSITPSSNFVTIAAQQFSIPPGGSKTIAASWRSGASTGNRSCSIEVKGSNLTQKRMIEVSAEVVQTTTPNPGGTPGDRATGIIQGSNVPPPPRADREQQIKIQTQIPSDVKMWLITDDGKRIDAVNGVFSIPASLNGKSVKVYFKKNGSQDWKRLRIGRDEISLPDGF